MNCMRLLLRKLANSTLLCVARALVVPWTPTPPSWLGGDGSCDSNSSAHRNTHRKVDPFLRPPWNAALPRCWAIHVGKCWKVRV